MKRILSIMLALLMLFCCAAVAESIVSGEYSYIVLPDGTAEITAYTGSTQALTLPSEIDGYVVSSIGRAAFKDNAAIESLTVPGNIKRIGKEAFYRCASLRELTLEEGVQEVMWTAFSNCALEELSLPESLATLDSFAFGTNPQLAKVYIPASVVNLTYNPFPYCDSLTEIIVDEGNPVLSVEEGVLFLSRTGADENAEPEKMLLCYPNGLTADSYTTPAGVHVIGDRAVTSAHLNTFVISESVEKLEFMPFYSCDALRTITVPASVQEINDTIFKSCENCKAIVPYASYAHQFCLENDIPHAIQ